MSTHERTTGSCEWYTPPWLFEAMGIAFDLDPCDRLGRTPAANHFGSHGLEKEWYGTVWLNPPYGAKRYDIVPWLEKFCEHGDGVAIVPNRTATKWWQDVAHSSELLIFIEGKVKFLRPDGTEGKSPGYGNVLVAIGNCADRLFYSDVAGGRGWIS